MINNVRRPADIPTSYAAMQDLLFKMIRTLDRQSKAINVQMQFDNGETRLIEVKEANGKMVRKLMTFVAEPIPYLMDENGDTR